MQHRCIGLLELWGIVAKPMVSAPWDDKWIDYQIAVKELLPSMCCMGTPMAAQVLVLCDNMAVVQVIAAQTSKEPVACVNAFDQMLAFFLYIE